MNVLFVVKWCLRPIGLFLYLVLYGAGYMWGHVAGGFLDGRTDAYRETE